MLTNDAQTRANGREAVWAEKLSITNTFPQTLPLPSADLADLLVARVVVDGKVEYASRVPQDRGTTVLAPGETVELTNVAWWKNLNLPDNINASNISVTFAFVTPGLWEVPASDRDAQPATYSWSQIAPLLKR